MFRYRLFKKEKWPVLMFHLAFLFIIIGAGVTRYVGYEGLMLINEGETTNQFLSETTYVNVIVDNSEEQKKLHMHLLLEGYGISQLIHDSIYNPHHAIQSCLLKHISYLIPESRNQ